MVVSAVKERDSAELQNVKLRNVELEAASTHTHTHAHTHGGAPRPGVDDLIHLTHLHEPAILDVLARRYSRDVIYTYTGPILLAVNPFQRLPLYTHTHTQEYYTHGMLRSAGMQVEPLPPHVYAVADAAYRCMVDEGAHRSVSNRNQSLLVSGESGAGKTETTKFIMKYLATVGRNKGSGAAGGDVGDATPSGSRTARATSDAFFPGGDPPEMLVSTVAAAAAEAATAGRGSVEDRVLKSNPILEAFGNAKTLRNENSSRFGKYITMQFSKRGELVGASIETYLLEKVRLVTQSDGERNYHVFYQICAGCTPAERERWKIGRPESYHYLNQSSCFTLRDGDDADEYRATRSAMTTMGIAEDEQAGLFDALAGLLHLGNGKFVELAGSAAAPAAKPGAKGTAKPLCTFAPDAEAAMKAVCELWGLTLPGLEAALTSKEIVAGTERYTTFFTCAQAAAALEALSKALYGRLFLWVVFAINKQIRASAAHVASFIGVLDIFGFEHFVHNSFEQLCINYANETLQQQFNQFVFKLEQAEYTREAISFNVGDFPDNQDCLDLIEAKKPPGILALLDEQCLLATATDDGFARKLADTFKDNARFSASAKQKAASQFVVRHYAGEVVYTASGFIDKNRDSIHKEALDLMVGSTSKMVRTFFQPDTWQLPAEADPAASSVTAPSADIDVAAVLAAATNALGGDAKTSSKVSSAKAVPAAAAAKTEAAGKPAGKPARGGLMSDTVSTQFKAQLVSLIGIIRSTTPHYVRCLKPNAKQVPKEFERSSVVSQLRCGGVLEAVRVARLGYPVRTPHAAFLTTYRCLADKAAFAAARELSKVNPKRAAETIIQSFGLVEGTVQVGNSKVFFRRAAFDDLEARRQRVLRAAAVKLQAVVRGRRALRKYRRARKTILRFQSLYRGHRARLLAHALRREKASIAVQAFVRRSLARVRFVRYRQAVLRLQCHKRGADARLRVLALRKVILVTRIAALWRMHKLRVRFRRMHDAALRLQCWVRQRRAKALLDRYKKEAREVGNLRANNDALKQENRALQASVEELQQRAEAAAMRALEQERELQKWRELVHVLSNGLITSLDEAHVQQGLRAVQQLRQLPEVASDATAAELPLPPTANADDRDAPSTEVTVAADSTAPVSATTPSRVIGATPASTAENAATQTDAAPVVDATGAMPTRTYRAISVQTEGVAAAAPAAGDDIYAEPGNDSPRSHHVAASAATPLKPQPASAQASVPAAAAAAPPAPYPTPVHLSEISSLKARLADAERRAEHAEKQAKELMEELASGRQPAAAVSSTVGASSSSSDASEAAQPAAPAANDLMEFTKKRTQKLEAQLQRAEAKILQLEKRIAVAEKAASDAGTSKLVAEKDLAEHRRENERLRTVVDSLQNQTVATYQKHVDELSTRVSSLQETHESMSRELGLLRAANKTLTDELRDKTAHYVEADDERIALRQKTQSDKQTMFQISRMIDAATGENRELKAENEALQHKVQMLQGENRIVREQAQRLSEALANLQQQRHVVGAGHLIPSQAAGETSKRRSSTTGPVDMQEVPLTGASKVAHGTSSSPPSLPAGISPPATPGTPGLARGPSSTSAAAPAAARPPTQRPPHVGPPGKPGAPPPPPAPAPAPAATGGKWLGIF